MSQSYQKPAILADHPSAYCPGCSHSMANKLIAEVLEEMGMADRTIMVLPVGCAVLSEHYMDLDGTIAAHGRAPAVATGVKRCKPDKLVFAYQGDGDLASIGMCETIHAANRGENVTIIFINNTIYGMTGGQLAPTTLVGQASTTGGPARDPLTTGYPIKMCELLNTLTAPKYIARFSLHNVPNIKKAKAGIRRAFELQMNGGGYGFVELLGTCSTNWKLSPTQALKFVEEQMIPNYPLGEFRVPEEEV